MRKKGRAHPDRVEATASHDTIKKTLAAVDTAMNASDGKKARELLCSIADHIADAMGYTPEVFRKTVMASEDAMVSRDAWIAYRRSRGPAEAEFGVYDNPKMTWKTLFGSKTEAIEERIDGLAREATGDALGAIGQRIVKGIAEGPDGQKVARLDLGALEDAVKASKAKFVAFVMPRAFLPSDLSNVITQGNYDCTDRNAMPCVARAHLKAALASLRNTAKDSHAWVDVSATWTTIGKAVAELPAVPDRQYREPGAIARHRVRYVLDEGSPPPCQEVRVREHREQTTTDEDGNVKTETVFVEDEEWVPVHGPIRIVQAKLRADLVFKWAVLREGGREGHIRFYGQTGVDPVDIIHTEPVQIIRPKKEKAA